MLGLNLILRETDLMKIGTSIYKLMLISNSNNIISNSQKECSIPSSLIIIPNILSIEKFHYFFIFPLLIILIKISY
jgi:hypothetical protein